MHYLSILLALTATAFSQTPKADPDANAPAASPAQNRQTKQLPPPGVKIPDADRAELSAEVAELGKELASLKDDPFYADVAVFHKAVDWALRYDEFYDVKQVATARELLKEGRARAAARKKDKAPWATQTGLVVRGYRSKIDGSVQPFGVIVPTTWKGAEDKKPRATWVWNHGRNEKLSELAFIAERMSKPGEFTPEDTFVIHPYGRYCNATKFAGEVDVLEALTAAWLAYPVDRYRIVNAGFSMGGASAWHLAAHYPGLWAASHAGAGFAESAEYAGVFAEGKTPPPWWEVILYRWYDATIYACNLASHPMFAYYGEQDKQKQATQIMKRFAEKEGVKIEEFIGPGVAHKYEPETKKKIAEKIAKVTAKGRVKFPDKVSHVAYSLLYPTNDWVWIKQLQKSWTPSEIQADYVDGVITVKTKNIETFSLDFHPAYYFEGWSVVPVTKVIVNGRIALDQKTKFGGQEIQSKELSGVTLSIGENGNWAPIEVKYGLPLEGMRTHFDPMRKSELQTAKNYQTCGPIDHAFMDGFIFVKPTGVPLNAKLGEWTERELVHATKQWRSIFRGDAPIINDSMISDKDIFAVPESELISKNLILWGDPSSNAVLKRIADKLPVKWTADGVEFGGKKYGPNHVPILIFPNPLNSSHYIVLNSGFTFSRAAASGTNSLQTPKLPDWAIVDISVPPDDKFPGKIVDAGFFDEQWKFTTERPK